MSKQTFVAMTTDGHFLYIGELKTFSHRPRHHAVAVTDLQRASVIDQLPSDLEMPHGYKLSDVVLMPARLVCTVVLSEPTSVS